MTEILNMVKEFGLPPIVGQILAFLFVIIAWQTKIAPYVDKWIYRKKLSRQSSTDIQVKNYLHDSLELILCDRLSVFEFHNSNHNLCGKSFIKYTCTYESCRLGVVPYNIHKKDLPISSMREVLNMINSDKEVVIDANSGNYSNGITNRLNETKAKYVILVPISHKGLLTGFLLVEFIRDIKLTKDDISDVINKSYILVGQIESKIDYGK